jgi:hypothetical protein
MNFNLTLIVVTPRRRLWLMIELVEERQRDCRLMVSSPRRERT